MFSEVLDVEYQGSYEKDHLIEKIDIKIWWLPFGLSKEEPFHESINWKEQVNEWSVHDKSKKPCWPLKWLIFIFPKLIKLIVWHQIFILLLNHQDATA